MLILNRLSSLLKWTIGMWGKQQRALVEVCQRLELLWSDPVAFRIFWSPEIPLSQTERDATEEKAFRLCDEIIAIAQRVTLPSTLEIIEMTDSIKNHGFGDTPYADLYQLLKKLEGQIRCGPYKRVRRVRRKLQERKLAEIREQYGVSPHLITDYPVIHISEPPGLEPIEHRWWHLRREKTCRRCHPKSGRVGETVVAKFKTKEDPK